MNIFRPALVGLLSAAVLLSVAAPSHAGVDVGVTLGYPGGYGIAQPSYVAPRPLYVQPAPVYVQPGPAYIERERHREWREWRERQERERYNRERYGQGQGHGYGHGDNGWHGDQGDWRGEHGRNDGWHR